MRSGRCDLRHLRFAPVETLLSRSATLLSSPSNGTCRVVSPRSVPRGPLNLAWSDDARDPTEATVKVSEQIGTCPRLAGWLLPISTGSRPRANLR